MKRVNSFLVVATISLFSTGIAEKAQMVAHLSQTPPPNCCCADSRNISDFFQLHPKLLYLLILVLFVSNAQIKSIRGTISTAQSHANTHEIDVISF
jgi:hypothetical protein